MWIGARGGSPCVLRCYRLESGRLERNSYVRREPYARALHGLTTGLGLLAVDTRVTWTVSPVEWRTVALGGAWAAFLVRSFDRLPEEAREFWRAASLPRLAETGRRSVSIPDLLRAADAVEALRSDDDDEIEQRVRSDLVHLRELMRQARGFPLEMMTESAFFAADEARRLAAGGHAASWRNEHGLSVGTVVGGRPSDSID